MRMMPVLKPHGIPAKSTGPTRRVSPSGILGIDGHEEYELIVMASSETQVSLQVEKDQLENFKASLRAEVI